MFSRSQLRNNHPISLLSVIIKLFEKVTDDELLQHIGDHNLLSSGQFGFRPSRSTEDLLLSDDCQDALDSGLDTLVIALEQWAPGEASGQVHPRCPAGLIQATSWAGP